MKMRRDPAHHGTGNETESGIPTGEIREDWTTSPRLGDDAGLFEPFEKTLICPSCNRPLQILIAPVHLKNPVLCPRCSRPLTTLLRREIRARYPNLAKLI